MLLVEINGANASTEQITAQAVQSITRGISLLLSTSIIWHMPHCMLNVTIGLTMCTYACNTALLWTTAAAHPVDKAIDAMANPARA